MNAASLLPAWALEAVREKERSAALVVLCDWADCENSAMERMKPASPLLAWELLTLACVALSVCAETLCPCALAHEA
jgi:hypothetical protein